MVIDMKEIGFMIRYKDMENLNEVMEMFMKDNGKIIV
jgi:hypothetical protein